MKLWGWMAGGQQAGAGSVWGGIQRKSSVMPGDAADPQTSAAPSRTSFPPTELPLMLYGSRTAVSPNSGVVDFGGSKAGQEKQMELGDDTWC